MLSGISGISGISERWSRDEILLADPETHAGTFCICMHELGYYILREVVA